MDEKQIIKWGLIALGAYLVWEYIQTNGGLSAVLGTTATAATTCPTGYILVSGQCVAAQPATTTIPAGTTTGTTPPATTAPPVLDITGLVVSPDINSSFTGSVKINGVPTTLSIITGTGQIFDASGADITATLQGEGVDIVGLRTAFANAGAGLSGIGAFSKPNPKWRPEWLN